MSLGGYTTALWASVAGPDEVGGIDFAVAMIPAVVDGEADVAPRRAHRRHVRSAAKAGITEDLLIDAFAVHAPTTRPARVPRDRLARDRRDAAIGSRRPSRPRRSRAHWDVPIEWFDGGHLAQIGRSEALRTVRRSSARWASPAATFRAVTRPTLAQAIASGPLLLDGAMGSLLYERGVLHTRSYDELNLSQPELIRTVHADYVARGRGADRDQHVRRQPDRARAPRPRRSGGRDQPRRRRARALGGGRARVRRGRGRPDRRAVRHRDRSRAAPRAVRPRRADRHARARRRRRDRARDLHLDPRDGGRDRGREGARADASR